jgi:hypothetical protein
VSKIAGAERVSRPQLVEGIPGASLSTAVWPQGWGLVSACSPAFRRSRLVDPHILHLSCGWLGASALLQSRQTLAVGQPRKWRVPQTHFGMAKYLVYPTPCVKLPLYSNNQKHGSLAHVRSETSTDFLSIRTSMVRSSYAFREARYS